MSQQNHIVEPEELMAYLDGELPPDRAAGTASHLEHCRECQKLAAELREISHTLSQWDVAEPNERHVAEIAEELKTREPEKPEHISAGRQAWIFFRKRGLVFAGASVAILIVLVITTTSSLKSVGPFGRFSTAPRPSATPAPGLQDALSLEGNIKTPSRDHQKTQIPAAPAASAALDKGENEEAEQEEQETAGGPVNGPMIVRTAELNVTTKEFEKARSSVDEILKRHHGYVGELNVNTPSGSARSLTGTLRVPASQLDATLADIKGLGTTQEESQGGEEVTQQYVDLQARLANARHTEQRLTDMLRDRTGKLSDVLAVEMQISRVRGEIEQMEAQRKNMKNQVDYATLTLTISEEYKEQLKAVPPSTGRQFRNAAVAGYRSLVDGIISVLLWLLSVGPTLLVWCAILFFPVRYLWKRLRPKFAK